MPVALDTNGVPMRLRELRQERNLTQAELAERAGTSEQNLRELEHNRRNPKADLLLRLAKALGVSVDTLLGNEAA